MRGAVVAEALEAAVREALGAEAEVRVVGPGEGAAALGELARLPLDLVVVDAGCGPGLAPATVRLRVARPSCRVVVLAAGRQPGDAEVGALVAAGVYDVCRDASELAATLARPAAGIAEAVAWLPSGLRPEAAEPRVVTRTVVRREVVERERVVAAPLPSHPAVVAVVGLWHGVGATTTAAAVAGWLSARRQDVVLVGDGALRLALAMGVRVDGAARPALVPGGKAAWALSQRRWAWVVVDAGTPGGSGAEWRWPEEAAGADVRVLLVPAEPWRHAERAAQWAEGVRRAAAEQAVVGMRWAPADGAAALRAAGRVWGRRGDAVPVPDLTAALRARVWPLGVADPRLDWAARALLGPLAEHLPRAS